ncbi:MAG: FAD/NAD(P)-binding oxidoreductase, partial [bacterium]
VNNETLGGDYLVISLGADLAPETIPGLEDGGHNIYTLAGCEAFRDEFQGFKKGKLAVVVSSVPFKCPAAPYEAAMLMAYDLRKRKVREQVQIDLFAAEAGPMGVAGPELSGAVRRMVEDRGIGYHPEHVIKGVDSGRGRLAFANGVEAAYDLLAYVPPHRAPAAVRETGLLGESGWVPVDRETMETSVAGVYAIGDVTGISLKLGKPLPKAGTFAHAQAEVVAHNIACQVLGKGRPRRFDGGGECFIEMGEGKAGFARGNFYAEPLPQVKMYKPGRHWHAGKVLFEKNWLRKWF